jgi:hypothetical protein
MGWIRSNLQRVRRMKSQLDGNALTLTLADGKQVHFQPAAFEENFTTNAARMRALHKDEPVPAPHPFGEALTRAVDLPATGFLVHAAEAQRRLNDQVAAHNEKP